MEKNGTERNRMGSDWMMRNEMGRDDKEWKGIG